MKLLLFPLLLISGYCTAQNCDSLTVKVTDKVTGKTSTSAKTNIVLTRDGGKTGISIYCLKYKDLVILSLHIAGAGPCINTTDKVNILFSNGDKLELKNDNAANCKGDFKLYFGGDFGKGDNLQQLQKSAIKTIRVWAGTSFVQQDMPVKEAAQLQGTLNCLANQ